MACCLAALLVLVVAHLSPHLTAEACRVLSVVTNVGSWVPTTGPKSGIGKPKATGYWLSEFTHSYTVFTKAGCKVTVASPKGGMGATDPQGYAFYAMDPFSQALIKKVKTGKDMVQSVPLTTNTVPLSKVNSKGYDIVFFVGGTGAMWDFKNDSNIKRIVRSMWESGKIVSAVCHGPMAFTQVKLSNGRWFVDGKMMTAFSNAEEELLGKANVCALCGSPLDPKCDPKTCNGPHMPTEYPRQGSYLIETKLRQHGAVYVSTEQDWKTFHYRPHVVRHGRLITGQNPGAGWETAEVVVDTYQIWKKCQKDADRLLTNRLCSPINLPGKPVTCRTIGQKITKSACK